MKARAARALAGLIAASGTSLAAAQQPPAPAFAPPNLTQNGVRSMAANCAACHGTNGRPAPGSALAPLAGRAQGEIIAIMAEFKSGKRPATLMHQIAKGFGDDEIAAIALYFEQQR
jgi:cytochrome c553